MKRKSCLLALCGLFAPLAPVSAHDIWMVTGNPRPQSSVEIVFGDLVGPSLADIKRIVSFDLVTPAGRQDLRGLLGEATSHGHPVLKTVATNLDPHGILAVTYDNGFWVRFPHDKLETNTSRLLAPSGVDQHWTVKWGKTLLGPGTNRIVLHTRLELVALEDPFAIKPGGTLAVRLEYEGKPLPAAAIAYTDGLEPLPDAKQPTVKTGSDGVARIPLRRTGPYLLTVAVMTRPAFQALAKQDHLYASLAFDTSHR